MGIEKRFFTSHKQNNCLPLVRGIQISQYSYMPGDEYCSIRALSKNHSNKDRIVFQEVSNMGLSQRIKGTILKDVICGDTCNIIFSKNNRMGNKAILSVLNSKAVNYYFKYFNQTNHVPIGEIKKIPFPSISDKEQRKLIEMVDKILNIKNENPNTDTSFLEQKIDLLVYRLYDLTYNEILIIDPETLITREEYLL